MATGMLEPRRTDKRPKWFTTDRQNYLSLLALRQTSLAAQGHGYCDHGHSNADHIEMCKNCWAKLQNGLNEAANGHVVDGKVHLGITLQEQIAALDAWSNKHPWQVEGRPEVNFSYHEDVREPWLVTLRGRSFPRFMHCRYRENYRYCQLQSCNYNGHVEDLIFDWQQLDADMRRAQEENESRWMHYLGTEPNSPQFKGGRFGTVSQEVYHSQQRLYYIEKFGVSVNHTTNVTIRLASSQTELIIDLGSIFQSKMSRNARNKLKRYGHMPLELQRKVDEICLKAVNAYLERTV